MAGTVTEMSEIREMEAQAAAEAGHQLRCFEIFAETLVERGDAEDGDLNEVLADGQPLIRWFERATGEGRFCRCDHEVTEEQW